MTQKVLVVAVDIPCFVINSNNEIAKYDRIILDEGEYLNIFKLIILFILLVTASFNAHYKVVHLLINHPKCNINEKDKDDQTALHYGEYLNIQYDRVIVNPLGNLKKVHNNNFYTVSNLYCICCVCITRNR